MEPPAAGLGDRAVGDLAGEGVLDRELPIVRGRRGTHCTDETPSSSSPKSGSPAPRRWTTGLCEARDPLPHPPGARPSRSAAADRSAPPARRARCPASRSRRRAGRAPTRPPSGRERRCRRVRRRAPRGRTGCRRPVRATSSRRSSGSAAGSISSRLRREPTESGSSHMNGCCCAFRRPTSPGDRRSSGRVVATSITGARTSETSRSRRSSRSGSAQWMSSDEEDRRAGSTQVSSTNATAAACSRSRASSGMEFGCDVQPQRQPEDLASFETGQHLARGELRLAQTEVLAHDLAERPGT